MPDWVVPSGGVLSILVGLVWAFTRDLLYTKGQVQQMLKAKDDAIVIATQNSDAWRGIAMEALAVNDRFNESVKPIEVALQANRQVLAALDARLGAKT